MIGDYKGGIASIHEYRSAGLGDGLLKDFCHIAEQVLRQFNINHVFKSRDKYLFLYLFMELVTRLYLFI